MAYPDGLRSGFGIAAPLRNAVCSTRSYFGRDHNGLGVYQAGTGFFVGNIRGSSAVMTAAHNLYNQELGRKAKCVKFHFGRRGQTALASRELRGAKVPREFLYGHSQLHRWDFALAIVSRLGSDRFVPLPIERSTALGETGKLIVGYPNEGRCSGMFLPYHSIVRVTPSSSNNYDYNNQETYQGMSGGPLIGRTQDDQQLVAYGLHTLGESSFAHRAIRFSEPVVRRLQSWFRN